MDDAKLIQVIGSAVGGGALAGALVLIVYRIASRVAERMIAAIDRIAVVVTEHTEKDLAHHAEVREAVVRLEAKLDAKLDAMDDFGAERPPSRPRQRVRTAAHGHRTPKTDE